MGMRNLLLTGFAVMAATMGMGCQSVREGRAGAPTLIEAEQPEVEADAVASAGMASGGSGPAAAPVPTIARQVAVQTEVYLAVPDIKSAVEAVVALVKRCQGYRQAQVGNRLTLKVPAANLEKVIAELEKVGQITSKNITVEDVTDNVIDLKIRIDNLEKLRRRLTELLAKANKVEDALKLEKELARITTELEILQGRQRNLANRIAYSTLTVYLNSRMPQQKVRQFIPVGWVQLLGLNLTGGCYSRPGSYRPYNFALPDEFVIIQADPAGRETVAANSDGVILRLSVRNGLEKAKPEFWHQVIRRALVEINSFRIVSDEKLTSADGLPGFRIEAEKNIGGKTYLYQLVVLTDTGANRLYLSECWGEKEWFDKVRELLVPAQSAARPWSWWQSAY